MAIDTKKLRRGEKVVCDSCLKGIFIPTFDAPPEKAPQFVCNNCGRKITFNFGLKKNISHP